METTVRIPVGVVVERQTAKSAWADFTWRPLSVLFGTPDAQPWTTLGESADTVAFYAGPAVLILHASEAPNYRDNLLTGDPKLWVVLRMSGTDVPFDVVCVTADGSEGEGLSSAGNDIVDVVPMPKAIIDLVTAFVAEHNVAQSFYKRIRDRPNLEALGRHGKGDEDSE